MKRLELYYSCNNKSIHHAQIRKMHHTVPYFKIFRHCQQSQQFTSNKRKEKRMQYNDIPLIGRQLFVYSHGPELQACMTALISHSAKTQPGEKEKKISSMQIRAHNLRSLAGPTSYQKKNKKITGFHFQILLSQILHINTGQAVISMDQSAVT